MGQNENAVMYGIEQICGLYGVRILRMQSKVVTVTGAAGRNRPMFFGQWIDDKGEKHSSGMADFLARPRVPLPLSVGLPNPPAYKGSAWDNLVTIPLWIEAKDKGGTQSYEQACFQQYVENNGEHYLLVNDFKILMDWFDAHGVRKTF